jgi:hypothetical protein
VPVLVATALAPALPAPGHGAGLRAQELADFDYENLSFRGIGFEVGYLTSPSRVEPDPTFGVRFDLGYLGPGVRITPSITWWESRMERGEVRELEGRVNDLANRARPPGAEPVSVDLGEVVWSDLVLGVDAHVVWSVPYGFLTYTGVGAAAHIQNGSGAAIDDTFVEDLLDSVAAGFNAHAGVEYPMNERLRLYGAARYELMGDLRYLELRVGTQIMFGPSAPGEVRR